jgi:hypothetical protein
VQALPKFSFHLLQFCLPPPAHGLPQHHKLPSARPAAAMGKTQKVEAVGLSLAALASVFLRLPPVFSG